ncbi:hypothetical protein ACFQ0T_41535 [Kitasatospora gansuensis]
MLRLTRFARPAGLAAASLALTLFSAAPAVSVAPPLSDAHVLAHLDLAAGQAPENIVLEPDGSADVTFIGARQIARIGLDGHTQVLATLPAPAVPATPLVGFAAVTGIARADDGTLYVNYATGTEDLTGVWRLSPGGVPERIAALPANGLPNGLALDQQHGDLYVADSVLGTVWRVSLQDGTRTAWATGTELQPRLHRRERPPQAPRRHLGVQHRPRDHPAHPDLPGRLLRRSRPGPPGSTGSTTSASPARATTCSPPATPPTRSCT